MEKNLGIELTISVGVLKYADYYIAHSPELQLSTQGKTIKQVKKRFQERVEIFIERALETDTLGKRLENLGWTLIENKPMPPKEVTVPLELLISKNYEQQSYPISC